MLGKVSRGTKVFSVQEKMRGRSWQTLESFTDEEIAKDHAKQWANIAKTETRVVTHVVK